MGCVRMELLAGGLVRQLSLRMEVNVGGSVTRRYQKR